MSPSSRTATRRGKYYATAISTQGRNRLRPIYEMVLNHYEKRKGIPAPYTRQAAEKLRPEGAAFQADHPGFGTLLFTLPPAVSDDDGSIVTLEPKPREGVLLNPGKGLVRWRLAQRHPKEVLDLLGMGVMRLDWASVEPQEGQFNWDALDRFLDSWGRLGKVCNVGVMCANTHGRDPEGYVTPKWVFDAGARKIEIMLNPDQSTTGTPGRKIAPCSTTRFSSTSSPTSCGPSRIATTATRASPCSTFARTATGARPTCHPFGVPDIAPEKFRQHVQMHLDAFKQTQLCLSRNAHLGRFGPLKPVFDWAVLEKHIAPRRDGICGNSDGSETAIGFGIAPGVFELFDNYDGVKTTRLVGRTEGQGRLRIHPGGMHRERQAHVGGPRSRRRIGIADGPREPRTHRASHQPHRLPFPPAARRLSPPGRAGRPRSGADLDQPGRRADLHPVRGCRRAAGRERQTRCDRLAAGMSSARSGCPASRRREDSAWHSRMFRPASIVSHWR